MMKKFFLALFVLALSVTISGCFGPTTEDTNVPADNETEVLDEEADELPEGDIDVDVEGDDVDETGDAEAIDEDVADDAANDGIVDDAEDTEEPAVEEALDDEETE